MCHRVKPDILESDISPGHLLEQVIEIAGRSVFDYFSGYLGHGSGMPLLQVFGSRSVMGNLMDHGIDGGLGMFQYIRAEKDLLGSPAVHPGRSHPVRSRRNNGSIRLLTPDYRAGHAER